MSEYHIKMGGTDIVVPAGYKNRRQRRLEAKRNRRK